MSEIKNICRDVYSLFFKNSREWYGDSVLLDSGDPLGFVLILGLFWRFSSLNWQTLLTGLSFRPAEAFLVHRDASWLVGGEAGVSGGRGAVSIHQLLCNRNSYQVVPTLTIEVTFSVQVAELPSTFPHSKQQPQWSNTVPDKQFAG